ncbi:helix-turn-helix transcriptional regulator [Qipengyuania qiaonensis]|uniref:YafY family transcriptional regulator n=1 Tax=Qipengyuania qiaonensis TaxID=2867240 RepID=A0ABS7J3U8_9SPHN|nr:YafY family protein [Qipengyuania qiaonensis]MBX7482004.1 YafY family transcriptional regulator [Qipengyuania qiaonensis]
MTRSERLLAIMQMLRARRGPVTAGVIADRFGVSERTIYRDILVLIDRGAVIRGEAGIGYVLDQDHFLPPLMFTADEADAIVFGLRYATRRGDTGLSCAAEHALAKITSVTPPDLARSMQANGLVVQPELGAIGQMVGQIRQAIRREHMITFDYVDQQGTRSHRSGMPVAIGFFDDGAMLAAWCNGRQDFRHFRLDRISGLHEQPERFDRPHRRLLAEYRKLEPGMQS